MIVLFPRVCLDQFFYYFSRLRAHQITKEQNAPWFGHANRFAQTAFGLRNVMDDTVGDHGIKRIVVVIQSFGINLR